MNLDVLDKVASISLMAPCERLALYSLIYAFRPRAILEIGFWEGGSAAVMMTALADAGSRSAMTSIDTSPRPSPAFTAVRESIGSHVTFTLVTGRSPDAVPAAAEAAGPIEFALIDGDHSTCAAYADIIAVANVMVPGGYVVLHDGHYQPVATAIAQAVRERRDLVDCGLISRHVIEVPNSPGPWGGLHLLRKSGSDVVAS